MEEVAMATTDQQNKRMQPPVGSNTTIAFGSVQMEEGGVFVGYENERYVIVRLPPDCEDVDLKKGQRLRLKYNVAGNVCSYETSVLHHLKKFGLVFLSHPKSVETNSMRKEERIQCRIPATASIQRGALKGLITDISHHGCQFCVKIPESFRLHQVSVLGEVFLSLSPALSEVDDPKPLKGKVRNTHFDEFQIVLGIEFEPLEEQFSQRLQTYIEKLRIFP